ncbi:MAG: DNA recombination protein RmuC [Pseudomonadota bacterium]
MDLNDTLIIVGTTPISLGATLLGGGGLALLIIMMWLWRSAAARHAQAEAEAHRLAVELDARAADTQRALAEMNGRMQTIADVFGARQGDLARSLTDRLDSFGQRLGENVQTQSRATHDSLSKLNERLAVIDTAQRKITELSQNVVGLQDILADKQQRGAFGQVRMEAIISDALPQTTYSFQATLSNRSRPDCLISLPGTDTALVVDAKFPLEGITRFRDAEDTPARDQAAKQIRTDVSKHIKDIHERYFLPGETQDVALMFVPSEAIYADLYEHFDDVVQAAFRKRVAIVGPSLLMLAVQVCQSILRDQRMREQAHVIQAEVGRLMADVHRLKDRVDNLQKHFSQAQNDITQIVTSADKVSGRSARIEALDLGQPEDAPVLPFRPQRAAE